MRGSMTHATLLHQSAGGGGLVRNGLVAEYRFDESRNLLRYSQQFDNDAWSKLRSSVTANATTAPDGTTTADCLIEDTTAANTHTLYQSPTIAGETTYTFSVYAKAGNRSWVQLRLFNSSPGVSFNLSTGVIGTKIGGASAYILSVGDGWYRCVMTATSAAGDTALCRIAIGEADNDITFDGNPTTYPAGIYIWGAQLELGSVARTYVKTTDKQLLMDYSRPRKNLLLPNQANCCEDGTTTGFLGYTKGAISASTAQKWQGAYSLKCITPNAAASEGITTNAYPTYGLRPGATYTTSVYLRGDAGGETVKLYLFERTDANGAVGSSNSDTITLTTEWQRVTVSRTFGATGRGALITVITTTQQAATFYVDGLQLEEGSTATAWEAPPNIGYSGSSPGNTTNDSYWNQYGCAYDVDDYNTIGGIYNAAGTLQNLYTTQIVFYTAEVTAASDKRTIVSFGTNKAVYLGAVGAGLTDETITVQYSATSFTYAKGTIAAGWHTLDLVWNGAQYEIWLDGTQLVGTDVDTPALLSLSNVLMRYDGTTFGSGLTGAHVRKYNRALTKTERNRNRAYVKGRLYSERGISIS